MRFLLIPFVLFENFLLSFCSNKDNRPSSGAGGPKNGMTDEQRNADGDDRIPTLRECLTGK